MDGKTNVNFKALCSFTVPLASFMLLSTCGPVGPHGELSRYQFTGHASASTFCLLAEGVAYALERNVHKMAVAVSHQTESNEQKNVLYTSCVYMQILYLSYVM